MLPLPEVTEPEPASDDDAEADDEEAVVVPSVVVPSFPQATTRESDPRAMKVVHRMGANRRHVADRGSVGICSER